jgi:hypothetical protein
MLMPKTSDVSKTSDVWKKLPLRKKKIHPAKTFFLLRIRNEKIVMG